MELSYSGQEQVKAPPAVVWAFISDPKRVARCLPKVQDVQIGDQGQIIAKVPIKMGFFKGEFGLDIVVEPHPEQNRALVRVSGAGLGSQLSLDAHADVVDLGDGTTRLDWQGRADLSGPIAKMNRSMLDPMVEKLLARTFQNMSAQMASSSEQLA